MLPLVPPLPSWSVLSASIVFAPLESIAPVAITSDPFVRLTAPVPLTSLAKSPVAALKIRDPLFATAPLPSPPPLFSVAVAPEAIEAEALRPGFGAIQV